MRPYAVYLNQAVLESTPRAGVQRTLISAFIRSLANSPDMLGDFIEHDETGRTVQVKIVGRYAITFWADHAVSEVKITHIEQADRD